MARDQNLVTESAKLSSKVVSMDRGRSAPKPLRKRALLVTGMHRSGTSAVTRVLNLLGTDLPQRLLPAKPDDNPLGYWESEDLAELHDELLESAGSAWDDIASLAESWLETEVGDTYRQKVISLLENDFHDSVLFTVKDPRLCRLIPFWLRVLEEFNAEPSFVIPIRNPLEVAASLRIRGDFHLAKSLLLWLGHVLETERMTRGHRRSIFAYEDLLADWRPVIEGIANDLDLTWPRLSHKTTAEISAFLSERYRHHHVSKEELESRQDVIPWVKETYAAVLELRTSSDAEITEQLDRIWCQLRTAEDAYGPFVADLRLTSDYAHGEVKRLEVELGAERAEVERLGGEVEELKSRLAEIEHELSARRAEVDRLTGEISERESRVAELKSELSVRRSGVDRLSGQISERDERLDELESQISRLDRERGASAAELAAAKDASRRLEAELSRRSRELADATKEIARLSGQLDSRVEAHAELERQKNRLEDTLATSRRELRRRHEELESSERESEKLRLQVEAREDEVETMRRRLDARRHEVADARSEVSRLCEELDLGRTEIAHMKIVVQERQQRLAAIREHSQRANACLEVARAECESLRAELNAAQAQLQYMTQSRSWRLTRPFRQLLEQWSQWSDGTP